MTTWAATVFGCGDESSGEDAERHVVIRRA
jgi:hypothetical protein